MPDDWNTKIQSVVEVAVGRHATELCREIGLRLAGEMAAARDEAAGQAGQNAAHRARQAVTGELRLAVQRLRQAGDFAGIGAPLLEAAAAQCGRAALLVCKGGADEETLRGWRAVGFAERGPASNGGGSRSGLSEGNSGGSGRGPDGFDGDFGCVMVPLSRAPALARVMESREPAVAAASPEQVSPEMAGLFGFAPGRKVHIVPLVVRGSVLAALLADAKAADHEVESTGLALLCAVAELALEALHGRTSGAGRPEGSAAVAGRAGVRLESSSAAQRESDAWERLPADEKLLHLQAQRFARVLVADLRLYRAAEIEEGRQRRDLYGPLKEEIDKSRAAYRRKFASTAAAGADYFHAELVRSLAGGDESLLGPEYPGAMRV